MIRSYLLPVHIVNNTEQLAGIEFIHDALLLCTQDPQIRLLIQDTTTNEHDGIIAAGGIWRAATQEEIDLYDASVIITPINPDILRAQQLLSTSPAVISQPEMWELMRIFGRIHGIPN